MKLEGNQLIKQKNKFLLCGAKAAQHVPS